MLINIFFKYNIHNNNNNNCIIIKYNIHVFSIMNHKVENLLFVICNKDMCLFNDITFETTSRAYEKETDVIVIRFTDGATGFVSGASFHCR